MLANPIPALKQQLAREILSSIANLNVTIAADVLQIGPARLADLRHGRVARFSVERLILMLATIDRRVALSVVNVGEPEIRCFRILRERRDERIRAAVVDVAAAGAAAKAGLKCGGGPPRGL